MVYINVNVIIPMLYVDVNVDLYILVLNIYPVLTHKFYPFYSSKDVILICFKLVGGPAGTNPYQYLMEKDLLGH